MAPNEVKEVESTVVETVANEVASYDERVKLALDGVAKAFTEAMEVHKVQLEIIMETSRFGNIPRIVASNDIIEEEKKQKEKQEAMQKLQEDLAKANAETKVEVETETTA